MKTLAADTAPKALVLAAGLGSRIRTVAGPLPKPLMPFAGAPILAHNLNWLSRSGVGQVWINLHYQPGMIRQAIGDGSAQQLRISYVYEPELLGTAGALANIAKVFDRAMLVVYGDNVVNFDLQDLVERHKASSAVATLALFDQARHLHTGIAGGRVLIDRTEQVIGFVEGAGGGAGLVNAGVYVVEPEVLDHIPRNRSVDFGHDVFPAMLQAGRTIRGHVIETAGYCLGLDTPESVAAGLRLLDQGRLPL